MFAFGVYLVAYILWNTRLRKCNSVIIQNFTSHILGLDITLVSWMVCRVLGRHDGSSPINSI